MQAFFRALLRFFFTGIATLLPLIVTAFVVSWLVRLLDAYIGPSSAFGLFIVTVFGPARYTSYVVGYLVVVALMILLGFLVTRATIARIHRSFDSTFARIPLLGKVYTAVGQVVSLLGAKEEAGLDRFGGVVQIRVGNVNMVALLTSGEKYVLRDGREHLLVFIPNSPIPATGFNVLVPVEQVQRLDMPVEDMAKMLISLGLLAPKVLSGPLARLAAEMRKDENGSAS
jgi:uncharacterized membrane protein